MEKKNKTVLYACVSFMLLIIVVYLITNDRSLLLSIHCGFYFILAVVELHFFFCLTMMMMKTLPTFRFVSCYQSQFACYHGMTARTKE